MSKNRMVALGIVALLHVFLGYAFITGLALKAVKQLIKPLETIDIKDEAPPPEEPPPPPPKDIDIPPYVPPPEVTVQSTVAPTITVQTQAPVLAPPVFVPAAPVAAPAPTPAPVATKPPTTATDRGRGNGIGEDDYPDASRRAEEQGVARVRFTVGTNGQVTACAVTTSSGFPRLDDATCKVIQRRWRFNPATKDGQPVEETKSRAVRWQLKDT